MVVQDLVAHNGIKFMGCLLVRILLEFVAKIALVMACGLLLHVNKLDTNHLVYHA